MPDLETSRRLQWAVFSAGLALWLLAGAVTWPVALSFYDAIGYVGQARLLLEGQLGPEIDSVGVWVTGSEAVVPVYPLFLPLLLAPLLAISPALVFLPSFASAGALAGISAAVLSRWRAAPAWGLLVLAHPTVILLSRTVMADLLLTSAAVGAWWALRRGRPAVTAVLFGLTVLAKPTGIPIAIALIVGEGLVLWRGQPATRESMLRAWRSAIAGGCLGAVAVVGMNLLTTGSPQYGYAWLRPDEPAFALAYLSSSGLVHLRTLLLLPPALLLGLWFLGRRRAWGPCLAIVSLTLMMSAYWFTDGGRTAVLDLVLAPRLLLPAVGLLMLGYADMLESLSRRLGLARAAPWILLILAPTLALAIGRHHSRWQAPMGEARLAAERVLERYGDGSIAMTAPALKAGILSRADLIWFRASERRPCVLLCNLDSSFRTGGIFYCDWPGYEQMEAIDTYRVLVHTTCLD